ncbi:hypothetical protein QJS10_CPB11g00216 [Acorus calamus]|uniref:RING-type domain-containing protein n=1 Tax=Acorus calamus TaxID=4465 RepID=A0AAV9DTJ1_ACOCL|nr:hypothetical protein QJS10_CPB11g00216 [Acorus calamus]
MAVQAQYPSNALFLNRKTEDTKTMLGGDHHFLQSQEFLHQPNLMFFSNGVTTHNPRKRTREAAPTTAPPPPPAADNLFYLQPKIPNQTGMISLSQPQQSPLVYTGLRLSSENQQQEEEQNGFFFSSSLLNEEISTQIKQQRDEIDRFLSTQAEQLRLSLAEKRQKHYQALLCAAEAAASRRLGEAVAEAEMAARRNAELEERVSRLRAESHAWQARAQAQEAAAAALRAELHRASEVVAAAAAEDRNAGSCGGADAAEDAESTYVDPERAEAGPGSVPVCRACRVRPVSVVVLPCRHLCLCSACDAAAEGGGGGGACPVCLSVRSASVQVFLS